VSLFTFQNLDDKINRVEFKKKHYKYASHGFVFFDSKEDMKASYLKLRKRSDVIVKERNDIGQWCTVMLQKTIMILSCY